MSTIPLYYSGLHTELRKSGAGIVCGRQSQSHRNSGSSGNEVGSGGSLRIHAHSLQAVSSNHSSDTLATHQAVAPSTSYYSNAGMNGDSAIIHRVREGDTMWSIAREYNTSIASLMEANAIDDPDVVLAYSIVTVPSLKHHSSSISKSYLRKETSLSQSFPLSPGVASLNSISSQTPETSSTLLVPSPSGAALPVSASESVTFRQGRQREEIQETLTEKTKLETLPDKKLEELRVEVKETIVESQEASPPFLHPFQDNLSNCSSGLLFLAALGVGVLLAALGLAVREVSNKVQEHIKMQEAQDAAEKLLREANRRRLSSCLQLDRAAGRPEMSRASSNISSDNASAAMTAIPVEPSAASQPEPLSTTPGLLQDSNDLAGQGMHGSSKRSVLAARSSGEGPDQQGEHFSEGNEEGVDVALQGGGGELDHLQMYSTEMAESYEKFLRDSGAQQAGRFRGGMPPKFKAASRQA